MLTLETQTIARAARQEPRVHNLEPEDLVALTVEAAGGKSLSTPRRFRISGMGMPVQIYKGQGRTLDQTYLYHSEHWRSAASYVALTRHRDKAEVFVARNTAADLKELARQMARVDNRKAASHYYQTGGIGSEESTSQSASRSGREPALDQGSAEKEKRQGRGLLDADLAEARRKVTAGKGPQPPDHTPGSIDPEESTDRTRSRDRGGGRSL